MKRGEIMAIALPAIITNITTPLLSLADIAITGHIGEASYIGAIALGGTFFNTLYWLFNFLRMGTTGLTAQAYGRGAGTSEALRRSMLTALFIGVALLLAGKFLGTTVLNFMDAEDAARAPADRYVAILIWGAPAVMGTYAAMGWLIGMQNTRATMITAIATNIINIAVSYILVFQVGMTIEGVAAGTLVAQWSGFVIAMAIIFIKYRPKKEKSADSLFGEDGKIWRFFRINADIFLRTACLVAVTLWFTHAGATQGVDILAANALLLQLFMLFSFFMDGFAYAAEALAGKYHGRADSAALRGLVRRLNIIGIVFAVIFVAVYAAAGSVIMSLLTDRPEVVTTARLYLPWAVALPLCGYTAFLYDGIFVGLTRTRAMLASMAAGLLAFFAVYIQSVTSMANHGLWLAFDVYLLTRGLVEVAIWRIIKG